MKAWRIESFGPPSSLVLRDLPMPVPGVGEALVRVRASGVNPSDVKIVSGAMGSTLPRTPGRDFAGVVTSEGPWRGKEVWGTGRGFGVDRDGAHAEYVPIPEEWLVEKPSTLTMEQASGIGVPFVTAWTALVDAASIEEGETLLVTGASGAVGRAAIQIAHWKGARVVGADRSAAPSLADASIDTTKGDIAAAVKDLTEGKGADLVLDTVGGPLFESCLRSLRVGGRQVAITSVGSRRVEFDLLDFYHNRLRLIGVDTLKLTGDEIARILRELRKGFEEGALAPPEISTGPLEDAVAAYESVAQGRSKTKRVLVVGE